MTQHVIKPVGIGQGFSVIPVDVNFNPVFSEEASLVVVDTYFHPQNGLSITPESLAILDSAKRGSWGIVPPEAATLWGISGKSSFFVKKSEGTGVERWEPYVKDAAAAYTTEITQVVNSGIQQMAPALGYWQSFIDSSGYKTVIRSPSSSAAEFLVNIYMRRRESIPDDPIPVYYSIPLESFRLSAVYGEGSLAKFAVRNKIVADLANTRDRWGNPATWYGGVSIEVGGLNDSPNPHSIDLRLKANLTASETLISDDVNAPPGTFLPIGSPVHLATGHLIGVTVALIGFTPA